MNHLQTHLMLVRCLANASSCNCLLHYHLCLLICYSFDHHDGECFSKNIRRRRRKNISVDIRYVFNYIMDHVGVMRLQSRRSRRIRLSVRPSVCLSGLKIVDQFTRPARWCKARFRSGSWSALCLCRACTRDVQTVIHRLRAHEFQLISRFIVPIAD